MYALGAAAMVATTAYYPARTALVPLVARSVEEAAAANAVSSLAKSAGALVGPLVAGLFLAAGSVTAALAASAAMWLVATVAVPAAAGVESVRRAEGRLYAEIVRGFSAAWAEPPARVALALFTAKNVGRAGSMVFVVALPLSLLGGQEGDAGFLLGSDRRGRDRRRLRGGGLRRAPGDGRADGARAGPVRPVVRGDRAWRPRSVWRWSAWRPTGSATRWSTRAATRCSPARCTTRCWPGCSAWSRPWDGLGGGGVDPGARRPST